MINLFFGSLIGLFLIGVSSDLQTNNRKLSKEIKKKELDYSESLRKDEDNVKQISDSNNIEEKKEAIKVALLVENKNTKIAVKLNNDLNKLMGKIESEIQKRNKILSQKELSKKQEKEIKKELNHFGKIYEFTYNLEAKNKQRIDKSNESIKQIKNLEKSYKLQQKKFTKVLELSYKSNENETI